MASQAPPEPGPTRRLRPLREIAVVVMVLALASVCAGYLVAAAAG